MPQGSSLRVKGYKEFVTACSHADRNVKREVRETFRQVGHVVRIDAAGRLDQYSPRSAAGFRTFVRVRGVGVEQALRKTTGKRPDWGRTQMRKALLPALDQNEERVERDFERAIDTVCDIFERSP